VLDVWQVQRGGLGGSCGKDQQGGANKSKGAHGTWVKGKQEPR